MNYQDFKKALVAASDPKKKIFADSLSGVSLPTRGVSAPLLKALIKSASKDPGIQPSEFDLRDCVEMQCSYFAISLLRLKDFGSQMSFLKDNLPLAEGWMVTDAIPSYLKQGSIEGYFPFFKAFAKSPLTYVRRFAYVEALQFRHDDGFLIFMPFLKGDREHYVMMAQAWLLAEMAVAHCDEVLVYMQQGGLDGALLRKAISKMNDSFRVSENDKRRANKIRDSL